MRRLILLLVLLASALQAYTQVTFVFNPQLNGNTLDGVLNVNLNNTANVPWEGTLQIKVREAASGQVVTVIVPELRLSQGLNRLSRGLLSRASTRYGDSPLARNLSQTGKFPAGSYEYCFEYVGSFLKDRVVGENCFDYFITPPTPMFLLTPADRSESCNVRPDFSWQPSLPLVPHTRFRLTLVQLDDGQERADAIANNTPLISQANISQPLLHFPANLQSLDTGRQYAWQVVAYNERELVARSEIWTFTVSCAARQKDSLVLDGYRMLTTSLDGSYYLADKVLLFAFNNPYAAGPLSYSITNIADPAARAKHLPKVQMQTGLNNVKLELRDARFFKTGNQYLLTVSISGINYLLRFTYKE